MRGGLELSQGSPPEESAGAGGGYRLAEDTDGCSAEAAENATCCLACLKKEKRELGPLGA